MPIIKAGWFPVEGDQPRHQGLLALTGNFRGLSFGVRSHKSQQGLGSRFICIKQGAILFVNCEKYVTVNQWNCQKFNFDINLIMNYLN